MAVISFVSRIGDMTNQKYNIVALTLKKKWQCLVVVITSSKFLLSSCSLYLSWWSFWSASSALCSVDTWGKLNWPLLLWLLLWVHKWLHYSGIHSNAHYICKYILFAHRLLMWLASPSALDWHLLAIHSSLRSDSECSVMCVICTDDFIWIDLCPPDVWQ